MPIDPSIVLGAKTDYGSPLDTAAKALSLRHLMDLNARAPMEQQAQQLQLQGAQMDMGAKQDAMAKEKAVTAAFQQAFDPKTGKLDDQKAVGLLYSADPAYAAKWTADRAKQNADFRESLQKQHANFIGIAGPASKQIVDEFDKMVASGVPPEIAQANLKPRIASTFDMFNQAGYGGEFHGGDPNAVTIDTLRGVAGQWGKGMEIDARRTGQDQMQQRIDQADRRMDQSDRRLADAEAARAQDADNSRLAPEDLTQMARQYIAGDTTVGAGLGFGKQGSANRVALRRAIRVEAENQGLTPEQVASKIAEFQGIKAAQRTLGNREAAAGMAVSEATNFADLAQEASKRFERTDFPMVNAAMKSYEENTGDPDVVAFGAANTSLINAYARAVSPTGTPTVSDKDHAREMLSVAHTQKQYEAVVAQLKREMDAAMKSPEAVRASLRESVTGDSAPVNDHPRDITDLIGKYRRGR